MGERGAGEPGEEMAAGQESQVEGPRREPEPEEEQGAGVEAWSSPESVEGEAEMSAEPMEQAGRRGAAMGIERVSVSVADDYLDRFGEVVAACERAGLNVEEALEFAGVVTGTIETSKRTNLDNVKGVAAVEQQRSIQIPPPESEIQ